MRVPLIKPSTNENYKLTAGYIELLTTVNWEWWMSLSFPYKINKDGARVYAVDYVKHISNQVREFSYAWVVDRTDIYSPYHLHILLSASPSAMRSQLYNGWCNTLHYSPVLFLGYLPWTFEYRI